MRSTPSNAVLCALCGLCISQSFRLLAFANPGWLWWSGAGPAVPCSSLCGLCCAVSCSVNSSHLGLSCFINSHPGLRGPLLLFLSPGNSDLQPQAHFASHFLGVAPCLVSSALDQSPLITIPLDGHCVLCVSCFQWEDQSGSCWPQSEFDCF